MSAEDLTTQAGLAVQQDLALVNLLGITHVERNGHHYVNGMAALPQAEQQAFLRAHPDLYERSHGAVRLRIREGEIALGSLDMVGFASGAMPDFGAMRAICEAAAAVGFAVAHRARPTNTDGCSHPWVAVSRRRTPPPHQYQSTRNASRRDHRRPQRAQQQPARADRSARRSRARSRATPAGFGALAITVRPPPRDRAGHQHVLRRGPTARDQRAEVGQRGVVGDRGQAERAEEQRGRRQARHERLQPPLLHAAQHHQAGEEEGRPAAPPCSISGPGSAA